MFAKRWYGYIAHSLLCYRGKMLYTRNFYRNNNIIVNCFVAWFGIFLQVLETITHPYSPEFVQLFLPMVENEEIMGSMRSEGDNDPVSEFIGRIFIYFLKANCFLLRIIFKFYKIQFKFTVHCKAHYMTV